ncbi:hypothetical protein [Humibacter sp. RRB41]|uniref:hypothetical protein n=1 Tax=Humibacter sp. RRB41 TaxID=2919946 RepID=UPI001FA98CD0|nr:hypothetical protein [Humibacter sp. RRB41]
MAHRKSIDFLLSFDYICSMQLSVSEYAQARGISRQRALAIINSGQVKAKRIGRSWAIDQVEVNQRPAISRPLSTKMARLLIAAMSSEHVELDAQERYFLDRYVGRLRSEASPLSLLHSWLRSRQLRVVDVAANPADIAEISSDVRVIASGISDDRAGISAARELEGYVAASALDGFLRDNLLLESDAPNIRLHMVEQLPAAPIPLGFVIADLIDWNRPREDGRAVELIEDIQWRR